MGRKAVAAVKLRGKALRWTSKFSVCGYANLKKEKQNNTRKKRVWQSTEFMRLMGATQQDSTQHGESQKDCSMLEMPLTTKSIFCIRAFQRFKVFRWVKWRLH